MSLYISVCIFFSCEGVVYLNCGLVLWSVMIRGSYIFVYSLCVLVFESLPSVVEVRGGRVNIRFWVVL